MTEEIRPDLSRRKVLGGGLALAGMIAAVGALDTRGAAAAVGDGAAFRAAGPALPASLVRASQTLVYPDAWSVRPFPLT